MPACTSRRQPDLASPNSSLGRCEPAPVTKGLANMTSRTQRVLRLVAATTVAAVALAACSSGGKPSSSDTNSNNNSNNGGTGAGDNSGYTIAMITHETPGDTFWDRIKAGAQQAAKNE